MTPPNPVPDVAYQTDCHTCIQLPDYTVRYIPEGQQEPTVFLYGCKTHLPVETDPSAAEQSIANFLCHRMEPGDKADWWVEPPKGTSTVEVVSREDSRVIASYTRTQEGDAPGTLEKRVS
jgi:hypothetical protein